MIVEIYDRWGTLVWKSDQGYPEPWDGRSLGGRKLPMDSYYYILDPGDGLEQFSGTITVVR